MKILLTAIATRRCLAARSSTQAAEWWEDYQSPAVSGVVAVHELGSHCRQAAAVTKLLPAIWRRHHETVVCACHSLASGSPGMG